MLSALSRLLYRWRWPVVLAWTAILLAALPLAPGVFRVLAAGGFSNRQLEAARAAALLTERLGYNPATLYVVYQTPDGGPLAADPRFLAEIADSLAAVRRLPEVAQVTTPTENPRQLAPDGRAAYAVIALRTVPEDFRRVLPAVESALQPGKLRMTVTGAPAVYADIETVTEHDLRRAEIISFPFAAVALLLVFGSIVAALLPGIVGGAAVAISLAAMVLIARVTDLSIFALNLTTMLGLGLGIDYSLFVVSRFREELARGASAERAVAATVATAGRAVLASGVTVFFGLMGLLFFDFTALRSLGIAGSLVVGVAVLAALTLLPALLGILGPRVDALAVARLFGRRGHAAGDPRPGFWSRLARTVMAHPLATLIPVLALLLALGWPFLRVDFGAPDASILPDSVPSRRGFDLLRRHWGEGELAPELLVFETTDGSAVLTPDRVGALYDFLRRVQADPRVLRVESIVTIDPRLSREQYQLLYAALAAGQAVDPYARTVAQSTVRGDTLVAYVTSRFGQTDDRSKELVRAIRATAPPAGFRLLVGGGTAGVIDYADRLYSDFPRTALFVVAAIYFVLLWTFRSVVVPLKAVVMNTLSLLASYGALVVIFQEGALSGLLGFRPLGFVEASLPIIMFCVLFGLSMDYEVFLLSRIKERHDAGDGNAASVAQGLEGSGRIITSAAAIVVLVSLSFVAADIVLIKALGLGTAIAVFLDATVVRALLVPATMRLLGEWNWWAPAWVRALLPRGSVDGA